MQWYEVSVCDLTCMYHTNVVDADEFRITINRITEDDVDSDPNGNPVPSVHFIGDDAFVVVCADRPIQALFKAIGLLTPDRRKKRKDVCLI